ncbi:MAG: ABC transporter ATP-binding protein [Propionibacteriaceae bacterium]|nr:ABC transporter ATP-binding protein [Propionibacteriaceae bacterium]
MVATFPRRTKLGLAVIILAGFVVSLFDLVGVGVVLPLMQVVTGAPLEGYLAQIHQWFGEPSRPRFTVYLTLTMVAAFLVKTILFAVLQWTTLKIVARMNVRTSTRLLASFLAEDYIDHRRRKTADLTRAVGTAVAMALTNVLGGLLSIVSQSLSLVMILTLLIITTPGPTLVALAYFGISVFIIQRTLNGPNRREGAIANESALLAGQVLLDSMNGFREVRMHDSSTFFLERYEHYKEQGAIASTKANFFGQLPKQLLEFITIGGLALLLLSLGASSSDPGAMMPSLALFVAAAIRMLPVIVSITATLGSIAFGRSGLRTTAETLVAQGISKQATADDSAEVVLDAEPLALHEVGFQYPDGDRPVLSDISLHVPIGSSIALCGVSGSGKTTLVDIILGLLEPTQGEVRYGEMPIADLNKAWRDHVAYVPQDVFVMNAPLRENIAFGEWPDKIDDDRLANAIERAQLQGVVADLPDGLDTVIGERGQRLSGGQRQRIGIARALYREPDVIVFDEATSALDNATEHLISQTIADLHGQVTTIIVAHRLSTVRGVDQLAFIENGQLTALGTFDEVSADNENFAELVRLGKLD